LGDDYGLPCESGDYSQNYANRSHCRRQISQDMMYGTYLHRLLPPFYLDGEIVHQIRHLEKRGRRLLLTD